VCFIVDSICGWARLRLRSHPLFDVESGRRGRQKSGYKIIKYYNLVNKRIPHQGEKRRTNCLGCIHVPEVKIQITFRSDFRQENFFCCTLACIDEFYFRTEKIAREKKKSKKFFFQCFTSIHTQKKKVFFAACP
jgi:hypothetical protein